MRSAPHVPSRHSSRPERRRMKASKNPATSVTALKVASTRRPSGVIASLFGTFALLLAAALATPSMASARAQGERQSARQAPAGHGSTLGVGQPTREAHAAQVLPGSRRHTPPTHLVWAVVPVAGGNSIASLGAVSCATSSFCLAVGGTFQGTGEKPYVASWNGATWTASRAPMPEGTASAELNAVSCATTSYCVAVGHAKTTSGTSEALIEEWTSSGLHVGHTPGEEGASSNVELRGAACTSPSFCMAVGVETSEPEGGATSAALAYGWNGTQWSRLPPPGGGGDQATLNSVSCSAPAACTAVGTIGSAAYIGRWSGSRWESQRPPAPTGEFAGHETFLSAVSCPLEALCVAVGGVLLGGADGSFSALQGTWHGSRWTTAPRVPLGPESVSCAAANCLAAGNTGEGGAGPYHEPTAERLEGGRWVLTHPIRPSRPSGFLGVSCSSTWKCFAVGYRISSGHQTALIERYS